MVAMKKGADALKSIHSNLWVSYYARLTIVLTNFSKVDKVDTVMDTVREQMDLSNEISEAISNPVGMGQIVDEDELEAELEALEQEELDDRLKGADHVPVHTPVSPVRVSAPSHQQAVDEDDEEAQLRQLQAELAM
jgi:charged multivesicular body protein 4